MQAEVCQVSRACFAHGPFLSRNKHGRDLTTTTQQNKTQSNYEACVERIKSDTTGEAHCTGQYFDYWSCVDHCVAPKLFHKLS